MINEEKYYVSNTWQNFWVKVVLIWLLSAPLIGFISEKLWSLIGFQVIARGITIITLLACVPKFSQIKFSKYFGMIFIYYLFTTIIPLLSGTNFKFRLNNEVLLCLIFLLSGNSKISPSTYNKALKWMIYLILISLVVTLIQEFYNPLFFVSKMQSEEFDWDLVDTNQYRLSSIWSFVNSTAGGYSIMAFYSVILGNLIEKKKNIWQVSMLAAIILLYCILSRQRWILAAYIIISSQMYRLFNKTSNQLIAMIVVLLFIGVLLYAGFPLFDVIQYRYLDKEAGGITQGSWRARAHSWDAFAKYFGSAWILGIGVTSQAKDYYSYLGRGGTQNLLGSIQPLIAYGIVGSIWYYILLIMLMRTGYKIGKKTTNYAFFVLFVAIVVAGFSNSASLADPGIMTAIIFMKFYEDKISIRNANIAMQTTNLRRKI